jgi:NADH-quinone oxidoreductase subunit J
MTISVTLFYFFLSLAVLSSLLVILSPNPVYSVLFLILSFCNVSSLLFLLRLEFLPISFLVIYVGAIAVLFLFVMMMLNIKLTELKDESFHFAPIAFIFTVTFLVELFVLFRSEFVPLILSNSFHITFLTDFSLSGLSSADPSCWYA